MTKNINVTDDEVSIMIINDSKENLLFKIFKNAQDITDDLGELSSPDVYEDISLGVIINYIILITYILITLA